jgi:hypothetical protein
MNKQQFLNYVKTDGVYMASLYAAQCGVCLAVVQLWVKGL